MNASHSKRNTLAAALSLLAPLACTTTDPKPNEAPPMHHTPAAVSAAQLPAGLAEVPGIRQPQAGLYIAAQPAQAQWRAFADAGVTTVINLRPDAELEDRDERAEVGAAGLRYVQIPVAGAAGITAANADALAQALQQADGPVLVHCASGNRVGALLALGAVRAGMPVEEAITYGKSAGLTSAEATVRERIAEEAAKD